VVVTRAKHQAGPLQSALEACGANVVLAPALAVVDPSDGGAALRSLVERLEQYAWLVVTSANGAERFLQAMGERVPPPQLRFASVGPSTTAALGEAGIDVAFEAHEAVGDALVAGFPAAGDAAEAVAVVRAEVGRPTVPDGLRELGYPVDVIAGYAVEPTTFDAATASAVAAADVITFASGRTAGFVVDALGVHALPSTVVCIGPVAASAAEELGLTVTAVAEPHTGEGIVAAVCALFAP
jgi:uroporphyrinogen-III synthase